MERAPAIKMRRYRITMDVVVKDANAVARIGRDLKYGDDGCGDEIASAILDLVDTPAELGQNISLTHSAIERLDDMTLKELDELFYAKVGVKE